MLKIVLLGLFAVAIFPTPIAAKPKMICNGPHEEYRCGSACQTTCLNLGKPCPIINIRCNDGCYCKEGFARIGKDDSICVAIALCPKRKGNSKNAEKGDN